MSASSMDALSAAVQRVEAQRRNDAPQPPRSASDRPAAHGVCITIPQQQQQPPPLYDPQQQQPWYEPMDGGAAPPRAPPVMATTPTMRITNILNDEPMEGESDDPDVVFVGAAAAPRTTDANAMDPRERAQWRHSHADLASASASIAAVNMRSGARLSNGDVPIAAGGGFTGISWPPGVQRSNVFDSRSTGGRQQQQRPPSPAAVAVQYPPHTQQQSQHPPTKTTKKSAAKRERVTLRRAPPPPTPAALPQPPVARATAPVPATSTTKNDTPSMRNKMETRNMWTDVEKAAFEEGVRLHGSNWSKVAEFIGTRSHKSVANYARRVRESAAKVTSTSRSRGGNSSGAGGTELQHGDMLEDANDINDTKPSLSGPLQQVILSDEPVHAPAPMAVRVLDLSSKEPVQRNRRGARHQETAVDTADTAAFAPESIEPSVAPAPAPASAPVTPAAAPDETAPALASVVNEVIEINTEESAAETPQKAPQRAAMRPPRAREQRRPLSAAAAKSNNEVVVKQPQRKKPKLTLNLTSGVENVPPVSSLSSSATRESGLIGSSALKPKKRGKKRLQQQEFDGITESPIAFSSSDDGRKCEFCNIARGVCATMHCTSCKRLYHTKCLVNHFRPHCQTEGDEPIEAQLEKLRLHAPPQVNVKMLRCAPCHAALLDNIKRDGYAWDCDCPSCQKPQKLVDYRREMVIQFLVHRVNEKPPKVKSKTSKQASKDDGAAKDAADVKKPAAQPTGTGMRRTRNSSPVPGSENKSMEVDSEASVEVAAAAAVVAVDATPALTIASGKKQPRGSKKKKASNGSAADEEATELPNSDAKETGGDDDENGEPENGGEPSADREGDDEQDVEMDDEANEEDDAVVEPDREKEASSSRLPSLSKSSPAATEVERDADAEPELTDEELLAAVLVSPDGNFETFRVVCTKTPSLTASGVMKEGVYFKHRDHSKDRIFCLCCEKRLTREQFVRHTDSAFLGESAEGKTPWHFLFARHHDGSASPLQRFLQILDQHRNSNKKIGVSLSSSKQNKKSPSKIPLASAADIQAEDVETAESLKTSLKQLESVIIARRAPGSADSKASNSSSSSGSSKPAYVIRLVCVSSKLTIPMLDGTVQNKLDRSTPGDFPYKDGWLFFDKGSNGTGPSTAVSPSYAHVLCDCCLREMDLGDFILHTGVMREQWDLKFKRRYVYVPQRDNQRALLDLDRIWQAILTLYKHQLLDNFMSSVPSVVLRL